VVVRTGRHPLGATAARWRFNHTMSARLLNRYDAVLGINGDGWVVAPDLAVPYMVLIKALYAGAAAYERQPARALLRVHARWEREGARRADLVRAPARFAADEAMHNYGFRVPVQVVAEPF